MEKIKNFEKFALNKQIIKALSSIKFVNPTPIQNKMIPLVNEKLDILGIAQTGTGKTAAYLLPILHNITKDKSKYEKKSCKTIVIAPTRELATQIFDNLLVFSKFLSIKTSLIIGGVKPNSQIKSVLNGVDVLVGTPGRIIDHLDSGCLILNFTTTVVLDEADQLMDLGFMPDIKKMYKYLPKKRQTIFITATMMKNIKDIALKFLRNHTEINLSPKSKTIEKITQKIILVEKASKLEKLKTLIRSEKIYQAIIYTRTKKRADNLAKILNKNKYSAMSFHGDKRQSQRTRILNNFKKSRVNFLIATDVAARGIDIDDIIFIINYDLPIQPEIYIHRIGRTARAGKEGTAITLYDETEIKRLKDIEKLIGYNFNINISNNKKLFKKKNKENNNVVKLSKKNNPKQVYKKLKAKKNKWLRK